MACASFRASSPLCASSVLFRTMVSSPLECDALCGAATFYEYYTAKERFVQSSPVASGYSTFLEPHVSGWRVEI